jgi:hypothetical protein
MRLIGLAVSRYTDRARYVTWILQGTPNTPAINFTEAFRQGLRDHGSRPPCRPPRSEDRHTRHLDDASARGRQEGHEHDPDRRHQRRSGPDGVGRDSRAAWWQHHRHRNPHRRTGIEKSSIAEGGVSQSRPRGRPVESRQSSVAPGAEAASGGCPGARCHHFRLLCEISQTWKQPLPLRPRRKLVPFWCSENRSSGCIDSRS